MEIMYVSMTVSPEDAKRIEEVLQKIVEQARELPGCLKYDWYINPELSRNFVLYAEFDTEDTYYRVYKKSPVLNQINQQLFPLLFGEPLFKHFSARIIESHNV